MLWSDFVRTYRRREGLSQLDLANKLGVDTATVSRWERGMVVPKNRSEFERIMAPEGCPYQIVIGFLPFPAYITDAEGLVTYANPACEEVLGREPKPGEDRWCVAHRILDEAGTPIDPGQGPMGRAIKNNEIVRGVRVIAERPDGSRVMIEPAPTPVRDERGVLIAAFNVMVPRGPVAAAILGTMAVVGAAIATAPTPRVEGTRDLSASAVAKSLSGAPHRRHKG